MRDPTDNDFLMHYGVLGMKWGQRRARNQAIRSANRKIKYETHNQAKRDKYLYKHMRGLSDAELHRFTQRQNALANAKRAYESTLPKKNNQGGKKSKGDSNQGNSIKSEVRKMAQKALLKEGEKQLNKLVSMQKVTKNTRISQLSTEIEMGSALYEKLRKAKHVRKGEF